MKPKGRHCNNGHWAILFQVPEIIYSPYYITLNTRKKHVKIGNTRPFKLCQSLSTFGAPDDEISVWVKLDRELNLERGLSKYRLTVSWTLKEVAQFILGQWVALMCMQRFCWYIAKPRQINLTLNDKKESTPSFSVIYLYKALKQCMSENVNIVNLQIIDRFCHVNVHQFTNENWAIFLEESI